MTAGPGFRVEGEAGLSFGSLTTLVFRDVHCVVKLRCSLTLWFEKEKRGRRCPREIRKLIEQNTDCLMFLHTLPRYPVPNRDNECECILRQPRDFPREGQSDQLNLRV